MKTFIVLIPVSGSLGDPRGACEQLENNKYVAGEFNTAKDVLKKVMYSLELTEDNDIEVEPITDFMDRVNNQEFSVEQYFISYVIM